MDFEIDLMSAEDWPSASEIYRQGIATGDATFATEPQDWEDWDKAHRKQCRLVARQNAQVLGWAALSAVSARRVYAGVAEVSVYVSESARGRGVGKALLRALIEQSEQNEIWTLQAGIFPENVASVALHKSCGFREVGVRQRLGKMGNRWRDVLLLERRSSSVGS